MDGTLIEAVEDGIKFIKRNTRLSSDIQSFKRHDLSEFPEIPMREVLINALAHTDYSLGGRIQIAIYDDRLEIQNPGLLPFGLTVEDLKSGISRIRNRTIARVFRELHLMEEWGSGYSRSIAFCTQYGYQKPEWYEVGSSIKVVFFPHPSFTQILSQDDPINVPTNDSVNVPVNFELNERQRWFLDTISAGKKMRTPHLATKWGVSEKTAKRDISFLQKNRLILFQGHPKNGHYILLKHESEKS